MTDNEIEELLTKLAQDAQIIRIRHGAPPYTHVAIQEQPPADRDHSQRTPVMLRRIEIHGGPESIANALTARDVLLAWQRDRGPGNGRPNENSAIELLERYIRKRDPKRMMPGKRPPRSRCTSIPGPSVDPSSAKAAITLALQGYGRKLRNRPLHLIGCPAQGVADNTARPASVNTRPRAVLATNP